MYRTGVSKQPDGQERRRDMREGNGTLTGYRYAEICAGKSNKCIKTKELTLYIGRSEDAASVSDFSLSRTFQKCMSRLSRRPFFLE